MAARNFKKMTALGLILCLLVGCQTHLHVHHQIAETFDPSRYRSFAIVAIMDEEERQFEGVINEGIAALLEDKGYVHNQTRPAQLLIRYDLAFTEENQLREATIDRNGEKVTLPRIEAVYEARMLVNILDADSHQIVWKASTIRDLRNANLKKIDPRRVRDRLEELFESFPAR